MNYLRLLFVPLALVVGGLLSACEPEFPVPQASSAVASFTVDAGDGFAPGTVTFTNTSTVLDGFNAAYAWNFGDGTSSTQENPTHTYTEAGTYQISLVVTTEDDLSVAHRALSLLDANALQVDVYFVDAGALAIQQVDGPAFDIGAYSTGLEYDPAADQLYWTDADAGTLNRADRDGGNAEVVATGMGDIRDVALDAPNDRAYVADRTNDAIWEIVLSTGQATILYDNTTHGLGQLPVGLDVHNGQLYITCVEIDAEAVWVGNVDGSGVSRILDYAAAGYGYGIAVDRVNDKLYFDNTDGGTVLRSNLDGTNVEVMFDTGNRVYGLVVDNANGKLYYTERNSGNVYMANLDGTDITVVGSGYTDPRGVVFIP